MNKNGSEKSSICCQLFINNKNNLYVIILVDIILEVQYYVFTDYFSDYGDLLNLLVRYQISR